MIRFRYSKPGNFGHLVAVKISDDFQFDARMVDRKSLKEGTGKWAKISWDTMIAGAPNKAMHRNCPIKKGPPKGKA
jgi:hypothetical protein